MNVLNAEDITAGYTDIDILKGVSIHVEKGEIVAIVGPNGGGKTTLMKVLFGLLNPREGEVYYKDENITELDPTERVKKGIGYVPQEENVFSSLTIMENLEMGGYLMEDIEKEISEIFEMFSSLKGREDQKVKELSGGEKQMVALGRALVSDPEILLLDEPGAGLAPDLKEMVYGKIIDINELGTSILMIEQNAKKALRTSDRGYVLQTGENKYKGRGEDLLQNQDVLDFYLGG
ncbi:branched-chain amino acid ABC transporter ATPase [candidate division MSBL1 archaeon SCGC-AAA382C18]|uniref:Branched-chain amino acid ABC transporter ATPase n=1 Tax=candidate division MSBL1 archaeon SCGC-AAA382C18 TaxID=1698281 RepID=A0A133VKJ3_9EURY|nr:branched-chain amino acid ABC transporter ATPase [candidate division MSBL1 archaeon SCGC-AAA382C18]